MLHCMKTNVSFVNMSLQGTGEEEQNMMPKVTTTN